MRHEFFRAVTHFGDSAVVLPLAAVLIAALWYFESPKAAWLLLRATVACLLAITLLKALFLSCGHVIGLNINSPSGHAGLSIFFYGALVTVVWARRHNPVRVLALTLASSLAVLVAVSRVVLGAHTPQEVIVGMLVGAFTLAWFTQPYLALAHPGIRLRGIACLLAPVLLLTYGMVLPAELVLRHLVQPFKIGICAA